MIDGVVLVLVSKYAFSKRVVKHLVPRIDRTECQSCRPKVLSLFSSFAQNAKRNHYCFETNPSKPHNSRNNRSDFALTFHIAIHFFLEPKIQ
jgi:hypothetical protein